MKYPIYEHFYAFQGEGIHTGLAAYFIRLYGCPLKCGWCDSAGTWHKDWNPNHIDKLESQELLELIKKNNKNGFIVLTGGEPSIFDLNPLIDCVKSELNIKFHIETSGAFHIKGNVDWITVSPKWDKLPLPENLDKADEIKIIVENQDSIQQWVEIIGKNLSIPVWLHPEWSQRNNPEVLNSISGYIKRNGGNFRAGYQLHKLYKVDSLDMNSKPLIPLGGNKNNGY